MAGSHPGDRRSDRGRPPDPAFSISVPVLGQAAFLRTALESIRAQTVPVELAVLDASRDDAAARVVRDYAPLVAYRYHRPDAGQAAAIQEGWTRTRGEIVGWLNADDYYFPDALARVAGVFRAHPEADVVYGHAVHVSGDGAFQMYFPAIHRDIRAITHGCVICQPACFARRRAVERVGGLNPALHYTMDWDLWVRLYRAGCTFRFLDGPLAVVRVHPATKTLSGAAARYREVRRLLRAGGVAWPRRLAVVLSLRRYDLLHRRRGSLAGPAHWLLTAGARARRALSRRPRASINGLECWTNRVERECTVELPWYGARPPRSLSLVTDRPARLSLRCNGQPVPLASQGTAPATFLGERVMGWRYRALLSVDSPSVLSFHLASGGGPWRLLSLAPGATP
jgi:glycosyltransferase involved in cell wall biosynthesis